jgi:acyl carrier protein
MIFGALRQVFRTANQKVAAFCEGRSRQADEEFTADCGLPAEPLAARVAVAVRRAVANIGSVDPLFIRAADLYPDQLGVLPLWDSMDWLAYLMELEKELGTRFSEEELWSSGEEPKRSRREVSISVREMAASTYRIMKQRETGDRS